MIVLREPYVFISYSREDAHYVSRLVAHLRSHNVDVWFDELVPNGARWREVLAERVERAAAVVLVESPAAQASMWVNEELLYAQRHGVQVLILVLAGELRFGLQAVQATSVRDGSLPGPAFLERARECVAAARSADGRARESFTATAEAWQAPRVQPDMVPRPETDAIVTALIGGSATVAVTGVYGGGGFGKTVAARMAVMRDEVRAAFPGGLLWVELGQERRGPELVATIAGLCRRLGSSDTVNGIDAAGRTLSALLAARPATLVVIDDVWYADQLAPFAEVDLGPARLLITTRIASVLPDDATRVKIDQLDRAQARAVLAYALPELPEKARDRLLDLTGGWAIAVKAANSVLRKAVRDGRDLVAVATWLADTLATDGPGELDLGQEYSRNKTIAATVDASLRLLDIEDRDRYLELGIFAEDTDIDFSALALLWGATGKLSVKRARHLAAALHEQSLVTDFRPEAGTLRLHDVVRAYLREKLGAAGVTATHAALLDAAAHQYDIAVSEPSGLEIRSWWDLPPSADYLWRHLAAHLSGADRVKELHALVTDVRWVAAKIRQVGVAELDADLSVVGSTIAESLRRVLRLEGHLLVPIEPGHSHDDVISARLAADPSLVATVERFRAQLPATPVRLVPGWPLPDTPDPAATRVLLGHERVVTGVTISPDGTWVATTSNDETVRIWDARTGRQRHVLTGHTGWVNCVAVSPDGALLATGGVDRTIRLWDASTGRSLLVLSGHAGSVTGVAFAPDGSWLASSSFDETARIWDLSTGSLRRELVGHTNTVTAVAIAPDGTWLATSGWDHTLRIWDVATGALQETMVGHQSPVTSVAIAPDGTWLVSTSNGHTARVWDISSRTPRLTLVGHVSGVTGAAITRDGSWVVTSGLDKTVRIWDSTTGRPLRVLSGHARAVNGVALGPDGNWLATASSDKTVRIWGTAAEGGGPAPAGYTHMLTSVAVTADGAVLATGSTDRTVQLWNAETGTLLRTLKGHDNWVSAVALSPDGSWLASASHDQTVRIWDTATGEPRRVLLGHTDTVTCVAVSADGASLATTSDDRTIRLWDAETGELRQTLTGHSNWVSAVAFSPDGSWLATGSFDQTVRLWDAATGQLRRTLTGHADTVTSVAIALDASYLVSTGYDGTVRVWDVETGSERVTLTGHAHRSVTAAIAPGGRWIATTGTDQTVRLWDPRNGAPLAAMRVAGVLNAAAVSHGGTRIYCGGSFGLYRFDVDSGERLRKEGDQLTDSGSRSG